LVLIFGEVLKKKFNKKIKIDNWYLKQNYLHFDYPISFDKAKQIVEDSNKVKEHSFFPFITFDIKSYKYKKNLITGNIEKQEKKRQICYSAHLDNCIYSYYARNLSIKYEEILTTHKMNESILAFRKLDNKSNIQFAKQAFDIIKEYEDCHVLAIDFSDFFGTLDHNILKEKWSEVLNVNKLPNDHYNIYKSLTKYSFVDKNKIYDLFNISNNNPKTRPKRICTIGNFRNRVRKDGHIQLNPKAEKEKGIPQGSSLSALLSNIYMIEFDKIIYNYVETFGGKYYRYCDDILIIDPESKSKERTSYIYKIIDKVKLTINQEKTKIRVFKIKDKILCSDKPLQYLGFLFDGKNIYLRSASITKYYQRMKKGVRLAKITREKYNKIRKSKGLLEKPLFKKKIYEKYSFLGNSNFVSYGLRAKDIMESKQIKKQIKRLWTKLNYEIES
jgi:hypothetical protein